MNKKAPIRAAIIEDEYPAARLLHKMLHEVRPDWEIILLPGSIDESVQWFNENPHPDILFLDIQLADGISFLFIERAQPESMIVFTTAYDQYAIRAFTVNSIDYLLKPIHVERLTEAIKKFERLTAGYSKKLNKQMDLNELMQALTAQEEKKYRTRFLISGNRKFYTIQVADIAYFYSEEKITFAVTRDRKSHIIDYPLNKLEEQLDPQLFFRANRQMILSANSIQHIEPYFNGKVIVQVDPPYKDSIQISREKINALKIWLDS